MIVGKAPVLVEPSVPLPEMPTCPLCKAEEEYRQKFIAPLWLEIQPLERRESLHEQVKRVRAALSQKISKSAKEKLGIRLNHLIRELDKKGGPLSQIETVKISSLRYLRSNLETDLRQMQRQHPKCPRCHISTGPGHTYNKNGHLCEGCKGIPISEGIPLLLARIFECNARGLEGRRWYEFAELLTSKPWTVIRQGHWERG